jgi:hypothetical protein
MVFITLVFEFLNFCKFSRISCCQKAMFFLYASNISGLSGYQSAFPGPQLFPGFPEIFFLVLSRPAKAQSCDLPTRDRISSKGPAKFGLW